MSATYVKNPPPNMGKTRNALLSNGSIGSSYAVSKNNNLSLYCTQKLANNISPDLEELTDKESVL